MQTPTNIFLIGPMGAGKSTIGKGLARELGYPFFDSDREIEARCGADIPWIFDVEGEAGFRRREQQIIDELTLNQGIVLATGGGAVTQASNREHLAQRGYVIYLMTTVEEQLARTARDRQRPLLQTPDPEGKLRELFEQRDPLYRQLADLIVRTDRRPPRYVIQEIQHQLTQAGHLQAQPDQDDLLSDD